MRAAGSPDPRNESEAERDDRNLAELLQELRVAGLGVQVLFGFLLSLPFTNKFARLSHGQRDLYLATLVLSALATALLLGPVAYHRLVFRRGQKEGLVRTASVMATGGLAVVGLAVSPRRPAGDRFCRQRGARGADHRLCRLRVRHLVVRVPARPPTLTRPESTSRERGVVAGQA